MNLILRSLYLDIEFLTIPMSIDEKLGFLIKKYAVLIKNLLTGFTLGKSHTNVLNNKFYYEDKYGIAFLQSVYVDNYFLKYFIEKADVVIDVGANIGQFNLFCRHYLNSKEVHSFEPMQNTFKLLSQNAHENAHHYAITCDESLQLYNPGTSLMASKFTGEHVKSAESVPCIKLDDYEPLKNIVQIDLFKIDTEGSELDVLKASIEIAKKSRYILVEASIHRESSGDILDLVKFLCNKIPNIKIAYMGRTYGQSNKISAIDILFYNSEA